MEYGIYSVRDALNGFCPPMCDTTDGSAARNFKYALSQPGVPSPSDFDLFRLGTFDIDSGRIVPEEFPILICRGLDVRKELEANGTC